MTAVRHTRHQKGPDKAGFGGVTRGRAFGAIWLGEENAISAQHIYPTVVTSVQIAQGTCLPCSLTLSALERAISSYGYACVRQESAQNPSWGVVRAGVSVVSRVREGRRRKTPQNILCAHPYDKLDTDTRPQHRFMVHTFSGASRVSNKQNRGRDYGQSLRRPTYLHGRNT